MTDWAGLVKPSLVGVAPYDPGESVSELMARHGLERVWKLNWNEDLFGPLDGVLDAARAELANSWMYPEQAYADLRRAIGDWIGVPPENVVSAHGIQALVGMVAAVFVSRGTTVVIPAPTYGLYAQVCAAAGAEVVRVPVGDDLRIDLAATAAAATEHGARLVWIADPNNPTGSVVTEAEWRSFLGALPPGCVAVVDEAYREYVDPAVRVVREQDVLAGRPVLLVRTFSKIFGLAGLRLGYAVAGEALASFFDVVQEPFNVNRAALAAGCASLRDPSLVEVRRRVAADARALLSRRLVDAGAEPYPSEANFLLVRLGGDDVRLADALARRGFLIRPGSDFGLSGFARITVGPDQAMEGVAGAIAAELKQR